MEEMEPHQIRVVDEKSELDSRLEKLNTFVYGEIFNGLPEDEQARLVKQSKIMKEYSDVLAERIAQF